MSFVQCPHCEIYIEVIALNCQIFRCGTLKETYTQIHPHLNKEECDKLKELNLIYGCAKPFRVDVIDGKYVSSICDYV